MDLPIPLLWVLFSQTFLASTTLLEMCGSSLRTARRQITRAPQPTEVFGKGAIVRNASFEVPVGSII